LAHDFYKTLHHFNECDVDYILAEGVENTGLGVAVMNRMEKACAGHIIYL
ncbi:MAG: threonylcarbamoyl-AMP synthase, partial [Veillonella sp.]|nr:threonylcarbamoyl-AMP synthase [Veillonella sp.]